MTMYANSFIWGVGYAVCWLNQWLVKSSKAVWRKGSGWRWVEMGGDGRGELTVGGYGGGYFAMGLRGYCWCEGSGGELSGVRRVEATERLIAKDGCWRWKPRSE